MFGGGTNTEQSEGGAKTWPYECGHPLRNGIDDVIYPL